MIVNIYIELIINNVIYIIISKSNRWKTADSTEAFKQFIPFMHTQKGVTTSTEAFFQPLTTKC